MLSSFPVKRWKQFENLVASIHSVLNTADYTVESDVTIQEPSGARHQVDVLLRPKTEFAGPVLVSCKAWSDPVGVDHIREWADIVQHTGAAAGVVVAESGFTSGAIEAAKNVSRRLSLWRPRKLTHEDFGPDERSPHGYISRVQTKGRIRDPQFVEGSLHFGLVRADGTSGGHEIEYTFSADTRKQWYARDELDNISANLWDIFAARVSAAEDSGVIEVPFKEPTFLVFSGVKFRIQRMSFEVVVRIHEFVIDVDMLKRGLAYENVVTGAVRIVPLPQLQGWQQPSTEEVSN